MRKEIKLIYTLAILAVSLIYFGLKSVSCEKPVTGSDEFFAVSRVIDGDTLKLSNGEKVRLIGIDTPEKYYGKKLLRDAKKDRKDIRTIQEMGNRATRFVKEFIAGKRVRLEFDIEKRDRYGRLLAYVYLDDGTFLNGKILEEGYAQVFTVPPNVKYADKLLSLQQDARKKKKGFWNSEYAKDKNI